MDILFVLPQKTELVKVKAVFKRNKPPPPPFGEALPEKVQLVKVLGVLKTTCAPPPLTVDLLPLIHSCSPPTNR